ncbi:uncharacterized protein with NRDE domain [Pseudomonas duriflava]|uniref:Uncharacterized protein with NRDE domain n=1 Tax=Pseudomonas duriflava TaxID=459528 RepID=A0A562Q674_9PSED|nr:NRDE family protein [Pseudomonas duriflava]TWI52275.1 uncharacterized protein with NRDE domain [Pseudomonas duriflava]
MCLIVFAWRPGKAEPLILAANRDEFYARPAAPLARWEDTSPIIGGRDLTAGGTWLAAAPGGRFAALTNIRDPHQTPSERSRGELTTRYLLGTLSAEAYMTEVAQHSHAYTGFNLLLGDRHTLWHLNSRSNHPRRLEAGLYGVSNADLDTPWPKLLRAKEALNKALNEATDDNLFALLGDTWRPDPATLPHTGVSAELEHLLSSVFISSRHYGTRASTVLRLNQEGLIQLVERRFGEQGVFLGEARQTL